MGRKGPHRRVSEGRKELEKIVKRWIMKFPKQTHNLRAFSLRVKNLQGHPTEGGQNTTAWERKR